MKRKFRDLVPQGNSALDQLRDSLNSQSPNRRKSAMEALQSVGTPEAVELIAAHVLREAKAYEIAILGMKWKSPRVRRFREDVIMPVLTVCVPFTLVALLLGNLSVDRTTAWLIFLAGVAATFIGSAMFHRPIDPAESEQKRPECHVFDELVKSKATCALDSLCLLLGGTLEISTIAAMTVVQLIELSSNSELQCLSREATRAICSAIIYGPFVGDHPVLRDAGLVALSVAGSEADLLRLEKWFKKVEARPGDFDAMRIFRERIERERLAKTLLRPSTEDDSITLLRPSSHVHDPDQSILLRPTSDDE